MITRRIVLAVFAALFAFAASTQATIIQLDLQGTAGFGLLPGNENPATTGGSGGEIGAGISFDTISSMLTINIGWGSGNGFTNLTGPATAGHIHGITDNPAPGSFTENKPVIIGLDSLAGWNASATNGGFSGSVLLDATQASALQQGRLYINVHTTANSTGEIRGYLVVPEPSTTILLGAGIAGAAAALWKRRRARM